ncbi:LysR family transcriptional regulator [Zooshikella marina]|uniref:LysR family transcriptional regulator n=1 Tax=Zooshikella ganghwensis TaxID=202772 RepID=A0A4P9VM22_9GAMM|nr:LysR family transcriptional regulator [Zooshikella ganghwensis]MBU2705281.1 LysR family transcriptional regulator [Zooshikella ganghwensis]RDH44428.1 LysR family transcriptional regulator [Zooshikella ganghwensis]
MDPQTLQAFIAVAESKSFSLAADQLCLTQPAVSKRIANLEQLLATRLFDRFGRQITLTEAGSALLPRAYRILANIEDTCREIRNLSGEVNGRLAIATSHHIGLHRLPPVLRQFSRTYPEVTLDIRFLDSEQAYEAIQHGEVEVAVITLAPSQVDHTSNGVKLVTENICSQLVWQDRLNFVVAPDHPLATQSSLTLAHLCSTKAVFPGSHTFTHSIVKQAFRTRGLTPTISMTTNYLETIKMMVSIGLAWSVLPATMLDDQLTALNPENILLNRYLGYIHHSERTLSNAASAFIKQLNEQIE